FADGKRFTIAVAKPGKLEARRVCLSAMLPELSMTKRMSTFGQAPASEPGPPPPVPSDASSPGPEGGPPPVPPSGSKPPDARVPHAARSVRENTEAQPTELIERLYQRVPGRATRLGGETIERLKHDWTEFQPRRNRSIQPSLDARHLADL